VIVSVLIHFDDKGPVFFLQQRATRDGKIFKVIKFRTMKVHSRNRSAVEGDERITKIGHVLRKYRIDELPQIFNIFYCCVLLHFFFTAFFLPVLVLLTVVSATSKGCQFPPIIFDLKSITAPDFVLRYFIMLRL
jgi:hypothetical protein